MSIELRIRNMMNEHRHMDEIVEMLLNTSASSKVQKSDLSTIAQFFVNSGYHKEYFRQFPRRFYEQSGITWTHFVEILLRQNIDIPNKVIEAIREGCEKTKSQENLCLNKKWLSVDDSLEPTRQKLWESKKNNQEKTRQIMIQKIHFFRTQRLLSDEKKAFAKFKEMFPNDDTLNSLYEEFKERQARSVVNRRNEENKFRKLKETDSQPISLEEKKIVDVVYNYCEVLTDLSSSDLHNLSIMFTNFEQYSYALNILNRINRPQIEDLLLKLELLMLSENYFEVLTHIEEIEKDYYENVEINFGLVYSKAQAYNFLNQKAKAANLLRSIVKLRPNYRSAQSLLNSIVEESE